MHIEKEYSVLPTTDGRFVVAISEKKKVPARPKLVYAKGKHALLYRAPNDVVVLGYLHAEAQKLLAKAKSAYVTEIDFENVKITQDYMLPVELVAKLPVRITENPAA